MVVRQTSQPTATVARVASVPPSLMLPVPAWLASLSWAPAMLGESTQAGQAWRIAAVTRGGIRSYLGVLIISLQ
jgi:hypothetical protein